MDRKYKKISKEDVFKIITDVETQINSCPLSIINVSNIAILLKTSRYQVKKHINKLVEEEVIELSMDIIYSDDEIIPPYWGYGVTDKGRTTELYKKIKKKNDDNFTEWVKECEYRINTVK